MGAYGEKADFFTLKGAVEELLDKARVFDYDVQPAIDEYAFHPGRCAHLIKGGKVFGVIGELHPQVLENYELGVRACAAVLDFNALFALSDPTRQYQPLPKFPAVTRDLAFVCDDEIPVLKLKRSIAAAAGNRLEKVTLFDVYKGKQVAEGKKSVAFNLVLRSADGTLKDEDADAIVKKVRKALTDLGAELRS